MKRNVLNIIFWTRPDYLTTFKCNSFFTKNIINVIYILMRITQIYSLEQRTFLALSIVKRNSWLIKKSKNKIRISSKHRNIVSDAFISILWHNNFPVFYLKYSFPFLTIKCPLRVDAHHEKCFYYVSLWWIHTANNYETIINCL